MNNELVKKLTGKNPNDFEFAAAKIINDSDVAAFFELVEKSDFLFDFINIQVVVGRQAIPCSVKLKRFYTVRRGTEANFINSFKTMTHPQITLIVLFKYSERLIKSPDLTYKLP